MTKTASMEEFERDLKECGLHPLPPLEVVMAETRMQIDEALSNILERSGLPLYLFDYLLTSVQNDMRKADLDTMRMRKEVSDGNTEQVRQL